MNTNQTILAALVLLSAKCAQGQTVCSSLPVAIPDNDAVGVTVQIDRPTSPAAIIDLVEVDLLIDHPWVGDLSVTITSPSGTTVTLLDQPGTPSVGFPGAFGCGGDQVNAVFADDATVDAESVCSFTAVPVITGRVRPSESLDAFIGEPAGGTWTVAVSDNAFADAGILQSVCLTLTTSPACPADLAAPFGELNFFDLGQFLAAFNLQDPAVDFAEPFGVFNFFDLGAFLEAFNAGCPS